MEFTHLVVGDVVYRDVAVPTRFVERWRGMKSHRGAMLFRASSVHGFGMQRALTVVAVDSEYRVMAVVTLEPGRVVSIPSALHLLELETTLEPPHVGAIVRPYDPTDGGTSRCVRHAHRQPRRHLGASQGDSPIG